MVDAICAALRAVFQTRTSSNAPLKNPAATPVEVSALPIETGEMLEAPGGGPTARRYQVVPS
jgi:hypothetical protein